jgi:GH24 family phage-related lysozyme (muramidase)
MTHPQTIKKAAALIELFEGKEVEAYLDPVGIPTICTGMTKYSNGEPVRLGDVCYEAICSAYTEEQIERDILPEVSKIPGWRKLGACRQAALISFAWNMGYDFFEKPEYEALQEVLKEGATRPEAYEDVEYILSLYSKSAGVQLPGLMYRREIESNEWRKESVKPIHLFASQDTYLKKAPIKEKELSDYGKHFVEVEEELVVSRLEEIAGDSHSKVIVFGSSESWYIEQPHWREKIATNFVTKKAEKVDWNILEDRVGNYLTIGEVLQYDPRRAPAEGSKEEKNLIELANQFDAIREAWGAPIGVVGGYRPEQQSIDDYHRKGMALDIYPVNDSVEDFARWLRKRWNGGLSLQKEKGYVHIDIRYHSRFSKRPQQSLKSLAI